MHETFRALLELHEVNLQRQRFTKDRQAREAKAAKAQAEFAKADTTAREAAAKAEQSQALIRQYAADVERCDKTIADKRALQVVAKTNKEYLGIINSIEEAKAEKRLREESLISLRAQVGALDEAAVKLRAAADVLKAKVDEAQAAIAATGTQAESERELMRIYDSKKPAVDGKFLEYYERLVVANHPMPLMKVDVRTRATPMGTVISHNHLEQIRLGGLVTETGSKAILYVDE